MVVFALGNGAEEGFEDVGLALVHRETAEDGDGLFGVVAVKVENKVPDILKDQRPVSSMRISILRPTRKISMVNNLLRLLREVLALLHPLQDLQHGCDSPPALWVAVEEAAAAVQQTAGHFYVVTCEVLDAEFETFEDGGGRADTEFRQLPNKPGIFYLSLNAKRVIISLQLPKLFQQSLDQLLPYVPA